MAAQHIDLICEYGMQRPLRQCVMHELRQRADNRLETVAASAWVALELSRPDFLKGIKTLWFWPFGLRFKSCPAPIS